MAEPKTRPRCEALSLKFVKLDDETTGRFRSVQCNNKAAVKIDRFAMCTRHVGMLFVYGTQELICEDEGHVWRINVLSTKPEVVRLNDHGEPRT